MLLPIAVLGQPSELLTNIGQVLALPVDRITNCLPVQVHGTVTFCNPYRTLLCIQDESGAIEVRLQIHWEDVSRQLEPGQIVEAQGVTAKGAIHTLVKEQHLRLAGCGPLPVPLQ